MKNQLFKKVLLGFCIFVCVGWASFFVIDLLYPVNLEYETQTGVVLSQDNTLLRSFADENGVWRYPTSIDKVSPNYIEALVGYEDRWFYYHIGVNPFSLFRAFFQYLKNGYIVSGGSTLTMQVARLKRSISRTFNGKVIQIFTAFQLEWHFSKKEILNYYLNHAPFGGVQQGVQAASYAYFEHGAENLTHAQAALLAVMPQAPTRYRPDLHSKVAEKARNKLLDRLEKFKIWSEETIEQAKKERVEGWQIVHQTKAPLLSRRLYNKGKKNQNKIHTFINYHLQLSLEQLARDYASDLPPRLSLAILVMNNNTGGVNAYVGSADFANNLRFAHVDMVTAMRSPGSTMKPFIYGMALDQGLIHSQSMLMDIPIQFKDYRPLNFNRSFTGPVSAAYALAHSLNLPAVQLLDHLEPMYFYTQMVNTGFEIKLPLNARPNLSLALGGFSTSLENLVQAYSCLGRKGKTIKPRYEINSEIVQNKLLSEGAAWIVHEILLPEKESQIIEEKNYFAVKTGTSYGFRDAWAIGVDKYYTAGVWVGRPDGIPVPGFYGAQTAEPLLKMAFQLLPKHSGEIERPESVAGSKISWPNGKKVKGAKNNSEYLRNAWLLNQTAPGTLTRRRDIQGFAVLNLEICCSSDNKYRVQTKCKKDIPCYKTKIELWPKALESFIPKVLHRSSLIPPVHPECEDISDILLNETIEIKGLSDRDAIIKKDKTNQYPVFDLTAQGGNGPWYWFENSEMKHIGKKFKFKPGHPGIYQILVVDKSGFLDQIQVQVF
ncbi:MAG: penicillin-binding protein 1C [Desulfobacteraceae bacterium]|nr:penicillin-binding protein 1C [Desulfobacteraceae bacterium]